MGLSHKFAAIDAAAKSEAAFASFWSLYPRKVGKLDAMKAWRQVTREYDPDEIISGLRHNLSTLQRKERQFVKHPGGWLRDGRWMDEPDSLFGADAIADTRLTVSPDFQKLWDAYPISDSEDYSGAAAAFAEIPLEDNPLILQAASWLKASLPQKFDPTYREKSRFIPSLKKWLSERRYESKRSMFNQMHQKKAQA